MFFDRPRLLPTIQQQEDNHVHTTPIYQNHAQFTYQQNYHTQHRNLKNYTFLQQTQPPSDHPSTQPMSHPSYPTPNNANKLNKVHTGDIHTQEETKNFCFC